MRDPKGVRNGKENGVWEPDAISHYIFLWSIRNSRLGTSSWGQGTKQQRKRSVTFTISFCSGVKAPTLLPCSSLLYFLTTCSALIMGLMSFVRISYTAKSNIGQFFFFLKVGGGEMDEKFSTLWFFSRGHRVMLHSRLLRAEGSSHGKRGVLCNA